MMNPFDFVKAINETKQDLIRGSENPDLAETFYKPYLVNKAFSYFKDTVMYANDINMYPNTDNKLQNDYYLNSIRKGKRYSKWHKKEEDDKKKKRVKILINFKKYVFLKTSFSNICILLFKLLL